MRHVPDCHVPPLGKPLVHDLTQMVMSGLEQGETLAGDGSLEFCPADNEELMPLAPKEVLGAYWMPMGFMLRRRAHRPSVRRGASREGKRGKRWRKYGLTAPVSGNRGSRSEASLPLTLIGGFALVGQAVRSSANPILTPASPDPAMALPGVGTVRWTQTQPYSVERWVERPGGDSRRRRDRTHVALVHSTGSSIGLRFAAIVPRTQCIR